jgi:hypothetical protein
VHRAQRSVVGLGEEWEKRRGTTTPVSDGGDNFTRIKRGTTTPVSDGEDNLARIRRGTPTPVSDGGDQEMNGVVVEKEKRRTRRTPYSLIGGSIAMSFFIMNLETMSGMI